MVNGSLAKPFDKRNSSTDSKENRFMTRLNQLYVSLKMLDPNNGAFRLGSRCTNLKRGTYLKPSDLAPNCSTRKMGIFANAYKASCQTMRSIWKNSPGLSPQAQEPKRTTSVGSPSAHLSTRQKAPDLRVQGLGLDLLRR